MNKSQPTSRLAAAIFILWVFLPASAIAEPLSQRREMELRSRITNLINPASPEGRVMSALKRDFPDEYFGMIRRASEMDLNDSSGAKALGQQTIRDFIRANRMNIAVAPVGALNRYAVAYANLMSVLRSENILLCARMAMGQNSAPSGPISANAASATATFAEASIVAAKAGISTPVHRRLDQASPHDLDLFAEALRRQKVRDDVLSLMAEEKLSEGTPSQQCDSGVAIITAIAQVEQSASARLTAALLVTP